jgi:hypothetical protein
LPHITLPQDENKMILFRGHHSRYPSIKATPEEHIFVPWPDYHFVFHMHERCWHLMTQVVDRDLLKQNIENLVTAMYEQKVKQNMLNKTPHGDRVWTTFATEIGRQFCTNLGKVSSYHLRPKRELLQYLTLDTLNDSYLGEKLSRQVNHENSIRKIKSRPQHSTPIRQMRRRSHSAFNAPKVFLPAEIVCMITDHLEHKSDIRNLSMMLPQWFSMIPNGYWRRRFRDESCMKTEWLPLVDPMDWHHFYRNTESSLKQSLSWKSRQYILTQLRSVKARFFEHIEERERLLENQNNQNH